MIGKQTYYLLEFKLNCKFI